MSEVSMLIHGTRFHFWTGVKISLNIDAVASISFSAPFDYNAPGFKKNFAPFGFAPVSIDVDDSRLFTGTMLDVSPVISEDGKKEISVNAYAKCGVLQDCTAPPESMPLEFNKLNLLDIAKKIASYFGVGVVFNADPGPAFDRVACDPDKKVLEFLADLAKQRAFVIGSDENGDLLFSKSSIGGIVARLEQGFSPLLSVSPDFNPQEYYSHLTGLSPVEVNKPAKKTTVKAKKSEKDEKPAGAGVGSAEIKTETKKESKSKAEKNKTPATYKKFTAIEDSPVYRPLVFKIDDAEGATDVETATKAKLARMLGNMCTYSISVATWFDADGNLWKPNTKLKLKAPDAMIYDFFEFDIKSVELSKDESSEIANLTLCLPGSFTGEPPEIFPWEM